jgi:hypothetical protein
MRKPITSLLAVALFTALMTTGAGAAAPPATDVTIAGGLTTDCIGASQPGGKVDGHDVTLSGCDYGVDANGHVKLTNLTVTGANIGVFSGGALQLTNSSVTGSTQVDLYSRAKPKLVNTTCGTSRRVGKTVTWVVCEND